VTDVAVAHKGRRGSTLVATGAAAHASEPEAGVNAVYRACDAVDAVRDLPAPEATVLGHAMRGSVAVTGIDGGESWNVIPERCEVTVDERTVPEDRADLERAAALDGIEWTVDQDLPPMACRDEAFADATLRAARAAHTHPADPLAGEGADDATDSRPTDAPTGPSPEQVVKPHATDAGWLAARADTACVVCGAAEPGEAHTATESVSLAVLDRCYRVYRLVAERFAGWPPSPYSPRRRPFETIWPSKIRCSKATSLSSSASESSVIRPIVAPSWIRLRVPGGSLSRCPQGLQIAVYLRGKPKPPSNEEECHEGTEGHSDSDLAYDAVDANGQQ
jgi:hypothetical protein